MVTCELCHNNVATVHMTEVVDGSVTELHFCDECARQKGFPFKTSSPEGLIQKIQHAIMKPAARAGAEPRCPDCGLTYSEFRAKARLGCPKDYEVFKTHLLPLLEKIHGHTAHRGKVPRRAGRAIVRERELGELEARLALLVKEEAYEAAAEVRNRIRRLKDELAGEAGK